MKGNPTMKEARQLKILKFRKIGLPFTTKTKDIASPFPTAQPAAATQKTEWMFLSPQRPRRLIWRWRF